MIVIGGKGYELMLNHKEGWNAEAFRGRYSEVLDRYDYIIGDWGYSQLRLKGFYRDNHPKANRDTAISGMADYINEYCNFGCAYFVLRKMKEVSKEELAAAAESAQAEIEEAGAADPQAPSAGQSGEREPSPRSQEAKASGPKGGASASNRTSGEAPAREPRKDKPYRERGGRDAQGRGLQKEHPGGRRPKESRRPGSGTGPNPGANPNAGANPATTSPTANAGGHPAATGSNANANPATTSPAANAGGNPPVTGPNTKPDSDAGRD